MWVRPGQGHVRDDGQGQRRQDHRGGVHQGLHGGRRALQDAFNEVKTNTEELLITINI